MLKKICILSIVAVIVSALPVWADGDFYVIAGGGPPVGTKITSIPYTIDNPGFYYLVKNLSGPIYIHSNNVTLDLMGFTLSGSGFGTGINIDGIFENVEIRNGTVFNFADGVGAYYSRPPEMCHRVTNMRVLPNTQRGINLAGSGHIIKGCSAYANDVGIRCSNSLLIHNVSTLNSTKNISGTGNTLVDNLF